MTPVDLSRQIRERLQQWERTAREATEGTWYRWSDLDGQDGFVTVGDAAGVIPEGEVSTPDETECNPVAKVYIPEDANLIAEMSPATVLALTAGLQVILELHPHSPYTDEEPGFELILPDHLCGGDRVKVTRGYVCATVAALAHAVGIPVEEVTR